MKCYFQILIISTVITVQWIGEVQCKPHKHIRKTILVKRPELPIKHVSLFLENLTPFGKIEFKHVINKRQAELTDIPSKDVPVIEGTLDDLSETKDLPEESHLDPQVIITSIVKPVDDGKSLSLTLPFDSEILVTPSHKTNEIIEKSVNEVFISKSESKQEVIETSVIEVASPAEEQNPKPIEPLPPPDVPVEPTAVINAIETPIQNEPPPIPSPSSPPIVKIPIYRTLNYPYVSPIGNEAKTFLYTDITKIPLSYASYPTPVADPVPEIILPQPPQPLPPPPPPLPPPPPPPPVIKEELPPKKEENPNFFVKGSRLVLYVGSMMLQMLSKFVNGGFDINQIPIPILPEVQ